MFIAKPLNDKRCNLGEGPTWDERLQRLYWVDFIGQAICFWDEATNEVTTIPTSHKVSAFALGEDKDPIVATEAGFQVLNIETGKCTKLIDPEEANEANRFNDGKVDPYGRFWAGSISADRSPTAALYCMYDKETVITKLRGVCNSNGLAWSPDEKMFYHIDTTMLQVFGYDYEKKSGDITNRRVVVDFTGKGFGKPDGMTMDVEGKLWIAHWGGALVSRWCPLTGEQLAQVAIPTSNVTSCTFGGANLDTLFVTTARSDENAEDTEGGKVFAIQVGVKGLPTNRRVF
jgi:sugar lactone lactonase YvrE